MPGSDGLLFLRPLLLSIPRPTDDLEAASPSWKSAA
jgi:hypothetical protein